MTARTPDRSPSGRAALLGRIDDQVRRLTATDGVRRAVLVVLDGAGRLGKTTLLEAVAARCEPPVTLLRVTAAPWEAGTPAAVLDQLDPGGAVTADPVTADPVTAAARFVERVCAPPDGPPEDGATVVVVDDADLADVWSLQVLASAVRRHRDRPLLVLAARTTGRATEAADLLDHVADERLRLAPLDAREVDDLAARAGVVLHPSLAEHLARHTGGRPDHVVALLASEPRETWRGTAPVLPAPPVVEAETRSRLDRLAPATRSLVEAVAVLGERTPLALAAAVAGVPAPPAAVDEAEAQGLVRRAGSGPATVLTVRDAMVAAAVRALLGAAGEARLHRAAAAHVEDEARSLEHAFAAGVLPDADLAQRAQELARDRAAGGAWGAAASLFLLASRASDAAPLRGDRLILAADALVGAGDIPAAASYLAEIESLPETAMRNAVLGYLAILRGRVSEAGSRLDRAWQLESGSRHPEVAATVAHRHVLHHLARCDGASLVAWADRAVDLVGEEHPTAVEARAIRGLGLGSTGRIDAALASYDALSGHASRGAVGQRVQMGAGWLHLVADEVDLARTELATAIPTDFLGGSERISLWARAWLARTHFVTGEWDQALREAETGLRIAESSGMTLLVPLLQWTVTQVHALRGGADVVVEASRSGSPGDYEIMRVPTCLARAALAEARADYAGVLSALGPLTRPDVSPDIAEPGYWPWPDVYANALVMQGRLEEAGAFLDVHERRAIERDHRSTRARLGSARGRLLGALGDLPAARQGFERSLELLEPVPLVYDRARVAFTYGQTLRRAGKRRDADAVMTAAREDWAALGATTYVQRCDRELKAGGVHAVLRGRPAEALTPQEQAVAGLVARGITNREVAAELFLSEKTVQFHLTHVFGKLGVRSRTELAALAPELLDEAPS